MFRISVVWITFWLLVTVTIAISHGSDIPSDEAKTDPVVTIKSGKIQGVTLKSAQGRNYHAFMGIPYAEPPLNHLRFKPPQPVKQWNGLFQANRRDVLCIQFDAGQYNDTEDCLVLNVYTPKLIIGKCSKPLPVMVAFHEGAFLFGSGSFNFYDPTRFMDSDVILVTTNYRLGVLGFLDTQDDKAPGNYGMMDQVATLKWVRDNIGVFGGDPEKISIFGCSAGGASVTYHLLSPMSEGLFKSAIVQSGTAINSWAIQKDPLAWAKKVGRLVNCSDVDSTQILVSCLRDASPEILVQARVSESVFEDYQYPFRIGPSVQSPGADRFLIEHPLKLLSDGRISNKVPVIIGFTKDEAFGQSYFRQFENDTKTFFEQIFCPLLTSIVDNNKITNEICSRAQKIYFNSTDIKDPIEFIDGVVKVIGEVGQSAGVSKTAELLADAGIPVQGYILNYMLQNSPDNEGRYVNHGDEMELMFDRRWPIEWSSNKLNFTADDSEMSKILIQIWTSFGTKLFNTLHVEGQDGKQVYWPLYNSPNRRFVELNLTHSVKYGPLCETMDFWQEVIWPKQV